MIVSSPTHCAIPLRVRGTPTLALSRESAWSFHSKVSVRFRPSSRFCVSHSSTLVGVTETVICIQDFATSLINNIFSLLKRMGNKLATRSHLDRSDQRRYMFSDPLPTCPLTPKSPLSPLLDSILPKISHLKSDHSFLTIGNHRILIRNNS